MRLRVNWLIPIFLAGSVVFYILRIQNIENGLIKSAIDRKPVDSKLLQKAIGQIFAPIPNTYEQKEKEIDRIVSDSHRSTLVTIRDTRSSMLVSNRSSMKIQISDKEFAELSKLESPQGISTFVRIGDRVWSIYPYNFTVNGNVYTLALHTEVKASIAGELRSHQINLGVGLAIFFLLFASVLSVYSRSIAQTAKSIENNSGTKEIPIDGWYPVEIAELISRYNQFIERDRISREQIAQSTCGQAIVVSTLDSVTITEANQALCEMLGYDRAELTGLPLNAICPEYSHPYHKGRGVWDEAKGRFVGTNAYPHGCPHANAAKSQVVEVDRSLRAIDKSGRSIDVILGVHLLSSNSKESVYAAVFTDVSELLEANQRLENLYRSLRHDIISSCAGVVNAIELMELRGFAPQEKYISSWDLLKDRAQLSHKLVSGTTRLGEGLNLKPTSLKKLEKAIRIFYGNNQRVKIEDFPDELVVMDDNAIVLRVLQNLIENGLKYCPENSTIRTGIKQKETSYTVYVADNGNGLKPDEIDKIMTGYGAFTRLNPDIPGTGTGLHTSRSALEAHGWKLECKSAVGSGSIFYFVIPRV